jgi:pimeloyl-ACP methyl ester carboxylesterase
MGGIIAAEMAPVAPREVERLGLIAPAGLWLARTPCPIFSKLPTSCRPHGNALRGRIVGAKLVRIPAAGHMVIVEQPETVVAALIQLD